MEYPGLMSAVKMIRHWFQSGKPWIWFTASAVSISMILVFGLLLLIAARGLGHFWPSDILEFHYQEQDGSTPVLIGEIHDEEQVSAARLRDAGIEITGDELVTRYLLKTGNRDIYGQDFRWVIEPNMRDLQTPEELLAVERWE